jgi:hypothetical protein
MHSGGTSAEPPCHHHDDGPANPNQQRSDDANAPCSRGQLIESKTYSCNRVVLQMAGTLPAGAPSLWTSHDTLHIFVPDGRRPDIASPTPLSILRI